MMYFYCSNLFVRFDDIQNAWVDPKLDKIYIKVKSGEIKSCLNGKVLFEEFKDVKKIADLRAYLKSHDLSSRQLADKLKISPPAISSLFSNKRISKSMERQIRKKYPLVFKDHDQVFNNPLPL